METNFIGIFVDIFDRLYQFIVAFSSQIQGALGETFSLTPINMLWFLIILSFIIIPFFKILPNWVASYELKREEESKKSKKNKK